MSERHFTPSEANQTLPLVRRIVVDILQTGQAMKKMVEEIGPQHVESHEPFRQAGDNMKELMQELQGIGCSFRDWNFQIGLVDFPAIIDGEEVLLCWRSDEPAVTWYHGIDAGYSGRQPIPDELLQLAN